MATVGNIDVNLRANTAAFDRRIRKSSNRLKVFTNSVAIMGQRMAAMTRRFALAGGVAGIGLGYLIKRTMESIDATSKLSDRLGMATENLVGLQHAAKITGLDTEGMNKSLETFVRRLGEMRMGVGQAGYALDSLGLSADQLADVTPTQGLMVIADRIKGLKTQADKAAAAYYLFGRQGVKMLNLLEEGGEGIRAYRKEADKMYMTFNRLEGAQVEAANDALTKMGEVLAGLSRTLTIELAPYIEALATSFVNVATSGEGMGSRIVGAIEDIGNSVYAVIQAFSDFDIKLKAFQAGAMEGIAGIYDAADKATNLDVLFKKLKWTDWTYVDEAKKLRAQAQAIMDTISPIAVERAVTGESRRNAFVEAIEAIRERGRRRQFEFMAEQADKWVGLKMPGLSIDVSVPEVTEKLQEDAGKTVQAVMDIDTAYRRMFSELNRKSEQTYNLRRQLLKKETAEYLKATQDKLLVEEWFTEQSALLNIERMRTQGNFFEGFAAGAETLNREMKTWGETGYDVATGMADAFSQGITQMIMDARSLGDVLRNLGRQIAEIIIMQQVAMPIASVIGGAISGAVGGMFASPNKVTLAPSTLMSPALANFYHGGGIVGQPTLQGLVPPDLFAGAPRLHKGLAADEYPAILQRGEAVLPRAAGTAKPGNLSVEINLFNETGEPAEASQGPIEFDGENLVVGVFLKHMRENGLIKQAIEGRV